MAVGLTQGWFECYCVANLAKMLVEHVAEKILYPRSYYQACAPTFDLPQAGVPKSRLLRPPHTYNRAYMCIICSASSHLTLSAKT